MLSDKKIELALNSIEKEMWPNGMFKAYATDPRYYAEAYDDLITFFSGFAGLYLMKIPNNRARQLNQIILSFIKSELLGNILWMWSAQGSYLRKYIPIDIDTSSVNSEYLLANGTSLKNHSILSRNKPFQGNLGFYTWLIPRFQFIGISIRNFATIFRHSFYCIPYWKMTPCGPHECNDVASMNVYHYLLQNEKTYLAKAEFFLNQFRSVNEMRDIYYLNDNIRCFLISRVLMFLSNEELRGRFLPTIPDVNNASDIELSTAILTYKNYNLSYPISWQNELVSRQQSEGNWNKTDVFCHGDKATWWCPGLNTTLAVAALLKNN